MLRENSQVIAPIILAATGSANPASSLSALWAYLLPALDHILKPSTGNVSTKAPAIDVVWYSGIHTAMYNYFTSQSEQSKVAKSKKNLPSGCDVYEKLSAYFSDAAKDILFNAPQDDSTLVLYLIRCFKCYDTGSKSANRLLGYINRHYVKRAVDEDMGWLRLSDVLESIAISVTSENTQEKISSGLCKQKILELKKWGYVDGGSNEAMRAAEACAEAASAPDRVIPVSTLALRCFRLECIEPLLAIPKVMSKSKTKTKKRKLAAGGKGPALPKGRLARAVKDLLESEYIEDEQRFRLATDCVELLKRTGVQYDHVLKKKLEKFVASCKEADQVQD